MNLITTISGEKASIIGLGSNPQMDIQCIEEAYKGGINYFFFYGLDSSQLVQEFAKLTKNHRQDLIIATGSEERKIDILEVYIHNFCQQLSIETIDIFLLEYISRQDDINEINELLNQLQNWKTKGIIRYVGISCHDRNLAVKFLNSGKIDILMHRYNMAHRQAEITVFPTAIDKQIPIISFTATRWQTLLKSYPKWQEKIPKALDCYRFVLQNPAIHLTLTSPKTLRELKENLEIFNHLNMNEEEYILWQKYGDLIYGKGKDDFETQWL